MSDGFDLLAAQRRVFGSDLGRTEKLIALALLDHWSRSTNTFPALPRLAQWSSSNERTVIRAVRELEDRGAIVVTRRIGQSSTYDLQGLMTLPLSESHPCQKVTTPIPVTTTPVPLSPPPLSESHPKEPSKGTQEKEPKVARSPRRATQVQLFNDPKGESEHSQVVEAYFKNFEVARGKKPFFEAKQGKAVKDLRLALGCEAAIALLGRVYAVGSFWRDKATIIGIAADPDKYDQAPQARNGVHRPQPGGMSADLLARARGGAQQRPMGGGE